MLRLALTAAALSLGLVSLVGSQPIGTNSNGYVRGPVTLGNCARFLNASTLTDAGKTCGHVTCTANGATDWSNACDLPLLGAILGF